VGEAPNIAARLQEKGLPNRVVISPTTYRLVTGLFEYEELGPQILKGLSSPLEVYAVVRESEAQSRFEVAIRTGLTPLIGREHEMGLLHERWERARQGSGQVVLLSGEPGIGKSRLVEELKDQLTREEATRIEFRCSAYHQNSAFYPIIEQLQRILQFGPNEQIAQILEARFPEISETEPELVARHYSEAGLIAKSKVDEAEELLLKAIDVARCQQAKSWELRAGMSLSRLRQRQGRNNEARQMLAEIYGWFTEGFDTKDLLDAKALLEEQN